MAEPPEKQDFDAMKVPELRKYLLDRGVSVSGYLKKTLVEIASAVEKLSLPVTSDLFEQDKSLIIHDMVIPNPFDVKAENDFTRSPPFGLFDIFNFLIFHSTDYDKQGLAAYKSFEDFRLFHDGYVESLLMTSLEHEGIHIYKAKVRPTMKIKTDEKKDFYDLWFILEGRGSNRGSVLKARCLCKGGRDGGCKHIAAAMYALEDFLNNRESVTSGPCRWSKRAKPDTEPTEIKKLCIEKLKKKSSKKSKRQNVYCQSIDIDVRAHDERNDLDEASLRDFTVKMSNLQSKPAIFPLFQKLYHVPKVSLESSKPTTTLGIMREKIQQLLSVPVDSLNVASQLFFTDEDREEVHNATMKQWQCEEWYLHKVGFISASLCHRVYTRQISLEKNPTENVTKLVNTITARKPSVLQPNTIETDPRNAREWGLVHEESARKAYHSVASHIHYKLELLPAGFLISKDKPFLGASLDNIQKCQCINGCPHSVVEYKCPWKHKDLPPKEAFLTPEVGGVETKNGFSLKTMSSYYYQVQLQMSVSKLSLCNFVVWTKQGIHTVQVKFDFDFMSKVCERLENFWVHHVLPSMVLELQPQKLHVSTQGKFEYYM